MKKLGPATGSQVTKKGHSKVGVKRKAPESHSEGTKRQKRKGTMDSLDSSDMDEESQSHVEPKGAADDEISNPEDKTHNIEDLGFQVRPKEADEENVDYPMKTGPRRGSWMGYGGDQVYDDPEGFSKATKEADNAKESTNPLHGGKA